MLHYTAADVDELSVPDFLLLVGMLEQLAKDRHAAQVAEAAELAKLTGGGS